MSFWDSAITGTIFEDCAFMVKQSVPDDYGGQQNKVWTQGATITANISKVTSNEQIIAEARDSVAIYKITTSKSVVLDYHDVIKRLSDGKLFRVTSDGDDMATPDVSTLDMRIVTAEEFTLAGGANG